MRLIDFLKANGCKVPEKKHYTKWEKNTPDGIYRTGFNQACSEWESVEIELPSVEDINKILLSKGKNLRDHYAVWYETRLTSDELADSIHSLLTKKEVKDETR